MKYTFLLGALFLGKVVTATAATTMDFIEVGTGSDSSFLIIDSPNIDERTYEVFYDFDSANPLGADDLLSIIGSEDSSIMFELGNFGDPTNQFLNSITFDGVTEAGGDNIGWIQWSAGGGAGFPTPNPIEGGEWTLGSGVSAPFRAVEPGSSDTVIFTNPLFNEAGDFVPAPPSFDPVVVPEPSGLALLAFGSLLLVGRRQRASV